MLGVEDKTSNQFSLTYAWILENKDVAGLEAERIMALLKLTD
jgi:hypothetical protein